jgi:hypothetical protein
MQLFKKFALIIAFMSAMFFGLMGTSYMFGPRGPWELPFWIRTAVNTAYFLALYLLFKSAEAGTKK